MLTDFITPSTNLIYLAVTGSTREEILKDFLDKLTQETLKNLSVTNEGTQEIYRLDDNLYEQTIYRVEFTTPSNASRVDPDSVV